MRAQRSHPSPLPLRPPSAPIYLLHGDAALLELLQENTLLLLFCASRLSPDQAAFGNLCSNDEEKGT